jgi:hypothetical protein
MGKKLLVALAMEGKFTSEGLQAIDGDDDMLTAMARELVENKGIGESADSVWKNLQQLKPAPSAPALESPDDATASEIEITAISVEPVPGSAIGKPVILPCESSPNRIESGQLSLF